MHSAQKHIEGKDCGVSHEYDQPMVGTCTLTYTQESVKWNYKWKIRAIT